MSLLEIKNLSLEIENKALLNGLTFSLEKNERVALIGESGAGKTSFSHLLFGWIPEGAKVSGQAFFDGVDLLKYPGAGFSGSLNLMFQDPETTFNPTMKIYPQLIEAGHTTQSLPHKLLDIGFKDPLKTLHSYPHELSGGMKQRLSFLMALARSPKLLITDEPTSNLDYKTARDLEEMLIKNSSSFLLITHDLHLADRHATKWIILRKGRIVEIGDKERIKSDPQNSYTKALLEVCYAT